MNVSTIEYLVKLRTTCIHHQSGVSIITDAPTDNNGKGEAFSPTDLLATSLGCCMATIMGIIADRHLLDIKGTKLEITKKMEENPRRVGEIRVDLDFPKNNFSDANKLLLENAAKTCPVAKSLHPDVKQMIKFNW